MAKNQKGFSAIEAVVVLFIAAVIGLVGWYVYKAKNDTDKNLRPNTSKTKVRSVNTLSKTYKNEYGNFTVKYPASWKLSTDFKNNNGEISNLTSPSGTKLVLRADKGGKGGMCEPAATDKPFRPGNSCNTREYLSAEKLNSIDNVYYARLTSVDGETPAEYEKADIMLVTSHFADTEGKSKYIVGLTASTSDLPIVLDKPEMGLVVDIESFGVYDKDGNFKPYIYAYAQGDAEEFLKSDDVVTVKEILRSLRLGL